MTLAPLLIHSIKAQAAHPPRELLWTVDEFCKAGELGVFQGKRVMLIEGRVVEMSAMGDDHVQAIRLLPKTLRALFPEDGFTVQVQCPFDVLQSTDPEPDIAVLSGAAETLKGIYSDALLIIEVSEKTLTYDRVVKARLYAQAGIADYWIANLVDRQLEVHRGPRQTPDGSWGYADVRMLKPGERVTPLAATSDVEVARLLP